MFEAILVYRSLKAGVGQLTGLSMDALHVHTGLAIMVVALAVLRGRPGAAFLVVVVLILANEAADLAFSLRRSAPHDWIGSVRDLAGTIVWPAILATYLTLRSPRRP